MRVLKSAAAGHYLGEEVLVGKVPRIGNFAAEARACFGRIAVTFKVLVSHRLHRSG